jgi:hypothetical protein
LAYITFTGMSHDKRFSCKKWTKFTYGIISISIQFES